jgi:hypothetical protein
MHKPGTHYQLAAELDYRGSASVDLEDRTSWTRQRGQMRSPRMAELERLAHSARTKPTPRMRRCPRCGPKPAEQFAHRDYACMACRAAIDAARAEREAREAEKAERRHCPVCGVKTARGGCCKKCNRNKRHEWRLNWAKAKRARLKAERAQAVGRILSAAGEVTK